MSPQKGLSFRTCLGRDEGESRYMLVDLRRGGNIKCAWLILMHSRSWGSFSTSLVSASVETKWPVAAVVPQGHGHPNESVALCPQNAATESFLGWTLLTQLPGSAQEGMEGQGSWGPARSFPQDGAHGGGRGRTLLAQKVAVEASRLERKS